MGEAGRRFACFEEMYESCYQEVYRYIRRMVFQNEDAVEDLTQEVFFIAYRKWALLKIHPNIPGFLMLTAQNKIKKWFEKQSRYFVDWEAVLEHMDREAGHVEKANTFDMVDLYSSVEHTLSARELYILRCYYEYGYSAAEMAGWLGITESCFKVRIARMKEKLKKNIHMSDTLFVFCSILWLASIMSRE